MAPASSDGQERTAKSQKCLAPPGCEAQLPRRLSQGGAVLVG